MEKNSKIEFVFSSDTNSHPDLIVLMKKINHVHLGLYKGFDSSSKTLVTYYFWAEYDRTGSLYRCFVTQGDDMKQWTFNAIESKKVSPYKITEIQSNILKELEGDLQKMVTAKGTLTAKYKALLKNEDIIFLRDNIEAPVTISEMIIIDSLESACKLDAKISFSLGN